MMESIRSSTRKVAIVDDLSLYSRRLIAHLNSSTCECFLYGPIISPQTKNAAILEKPDNTVLRVWSQKLFPFQIFRRATRDRVNVVHVQFEFYGIHSIGPVYYSLQLPLSLALLRLVRIKTVVTLHSVIPRGSQLREVKETSPNSKVLPITLLSFFLTLSYKLVSVLSNALVVHSEVFRNRLKTSYGIRGRTVFVIPHGIEIFKRVDRKEIPYSRHGKASILFFGVLSPRKGVDMLLRAFSKLLEWGFDCSLDLAGSSPPYYRGYEMELKALAKRLGLAQSVNFLGFVPNDLAHDLFERARFVTLPYRYDVSASGALAWALAHGTPVVASDTMFFEEVNKRFPFAILVPPQNPMELAIAMRKLLVDDKLCVELAKNARQTAFCNSWNRIAEMTSECYQIIERPN